MAYKVIECIVFTKNTQILKIAVFAINDLSNHQKYPQKTITQSRFAQFFQFCLPLLTKCHQVYEMYVAGFKFHLLNNAFTSHWGFQVQQDKVLLKTTKVKRFIIRKIIRKKLIPGDFNNHLTALALADRKKKQEENVLQE